jgi:hypothetical protein
MIIRRAAGSTARRATSDLNELELGKSMSKISGATRRSRRWMTLLTVLVGAVALSAVPAGAAQPRAVPSLRLSAVRPATVAGTVGQLNAVSCPSASSCVAVGDNGKTEASVAGVRAIAEAWNGQAWHTLPAPAAPPGSQADTLEAVDCTSVTSCIAVGYYERFAPYVEVVFAERWSGTKWTFMSLPRPRGAVESVLSSVACPSANECLAAGGYAESSDSAGDPGPESNLIEVWNGKTWNFQSPAGPVDFQNDGFFAISCSSTSYCMAVGNWTSNNGSDSPMAVSWNGHVWTVLPEGPSQPLLYGVSCYSATGCVAVGLRFTDGNTTSIAELWNGHGWRYIYYPPFGGAGNNSQVYSIDCTAATFCMAVGEVFTDAQPALVKPGTQYWNGKSWTAVAAPSPKGQMGPNYWPAGVSCPSDADCVAVGGYTRPDGSIGTVAESWMAGQGWRLFAS